MLSETQVQQGNSLDVDVYKRQGQPLHGEQVFQCLMRSAVRANRDSSVRSGNQDVQVCVAH